MGLMFSNEELVLMFTKHMTITISNYMDANDVNFDTACAELNIEDNLKQYLSKNIIVEKCFADKGNECSILTQKNCLKCKFYKKEKNIDLNKIENDIDNYALR